MDKIELSNKTIAKLAIAMANAAEFQKNESASATTERILETLDTIDSLPHFNSYIPHSSAPVTVD
ncbi:MAG TPA: hypothetical protein VGI75_03410 [Pirellulales bacterium]|jgi:hypothetical protein